jgi:dihydrofolate synthase/folylpolyglutamate synthase
LNSKIIVSKQSSNEIIDKIKDSIKKNSSNQLIFGNDFNYSLNENGFFYYEDRYGGLKLPLPNLEGEFQLSNVATAIATVRNLEEINVSDENIKSGITKIRSIARFQEIKNGKLKDLAKKNKIYIDGSHNSLGASALSKHLSLLKCNKHIILGMMSNKDHIDYMDHFKNKISSLTTVDIPNQPNAISGEELMKKLKNSKNVKYKKSIKEAIKSINLKNKDIIIITGSLYLAGEVLNQN